MRGRRLNQRLVLSALTIDLFVTLWPGLLYLGAGTLSSTSSADLWLFFSEASLPLVILALGLIVVGVWRSGSMGLRMSQLLVTFSIVAIFGWMTVGSFPIGVGSWAAMDCGYLNPSKCTLVQAGGYADLYYLPSLALTIVLLLCGLGNLVSLDDSPKKITVEQTPVTQDPKAGLQLRSWREFLLTTRGLGRASRAEVPFQKGTGDRNLLYLEAESGGNLTVKSVHF